MTELFREDEGSTPVLQPCTQTCMVDPLITEMEDRRVLDSFNPHKGAGPDGLIPKVFKAFKSHISSVLPRMFNLSLQTYCHQHALSVRDVHYWNKLPD